MRILIVSDAWHPQINGVVRTLEATSRELQRMGHEVKVVGPDLQSWRSFPAPSYPSIRLEFFAHGRLQQIMASFQPDVIHIATEGPLGWAVRHVCLGQGRPFTTSYHTRFPEYLAARVRPSWRASVTTTTYALLRFFHAPSSAVMIATPSIKRELLQKKFHRLVRWSRGVDTERFQPYGKNVPAYDGLPRPISLYVGRVAIEKNIEAFLKADAPGTKVVIGNGPDLQLLKTSYPHVRFLGAMEDDVLARHYAAADLFVFPSMTDTFGLVLLEAAASGLRIASYPAPGPVDIFADPAARNFCVLHTDLGSAMQRALRLPDNPDAPRSFAEKFSWSVSAQQFYQHLQAPTPGAVRRVTRLRHWMQRGWQRALRRMGRAR
jgi:glycosyltransferase involved in cell wall biosynthesis